MRMIPQQMPMEPVGHRFEIADYTRTAPAGSYTAPWAEIAADLRARASSFTEYRTSGERFTADILASLREGAPAPDPRHFLRSFANAVDVTISELRLEAFLPADEATSAALTRAAERPGSG